MRKYIPGLTVGFRGRIATSVLLGILRVAAGLIFVVLSKRAVDIAIGNVAGNLKMCIIWLVTVLAFELLCATLRNRTIELSEIEMKNTLQERLFRRLLTATWAGKDKFHSGDSLSRLTEDCRMVAECICRTVPTIIISLLQFIGAFLFLWYLSPILSMSLMVILPIFIFAGKAFFRRVRKLTQKIRNIEGRLQAMMQESLQHRLLLLASRQTARIMDNIARRHKARYRTMRRRTDVTLFSRTSVLAGFEAGYLTAFLWGIKGLYMRTISFGTMTAYLQLAGQIQRPLLELANLFPALIQSHTAFSRISEIDGIDTEDGDDNTIKEHFDSAAGLTFKDISFSYPGTKQIFNHFSYTFEPGSKTAIMGESGAGKSTLLLLALAILKPQEGEVEVFWHSGSEREMVSSATRSNFVYVPQGNTLLSGTIRQNLQLGNPDATEEEMRKALHCAAADFVFDLSRGLDTVCGEHGEGLSEGQAQRIAIARGLLQKGTILLLDEISASLDEDTERLLWKRITSQRNSHTVIIVTHRSVALDYFDKVIKLMKG